MEKYSHWPFEVSGYKVSILDPISERNIIMTTWKEWFEKNMAELVTEKEFPGLHAVYYNYKNPLDQSKKWYDMLIWYVTKTGAIQKNPSIRTIKIPSQDYRYTTINDISPESIFGTWKDINSSSPAELQRTYGFDLDMYDEAHTRLTIAVSVSE